MAVSGSPLTSNVSSAEWPSADTWPPLERGETMFVASGCAATALRTSPIVERKAPSLTVRTLLCTRTISPDALLKPAFSMIVSARLDSPSKACESVGFLVPAIWPSTSARATKASHPEMAVFLCRALQRPARAAMPPVLVCMVMGAPEGVMGRTSAESPQAPLHAPEVPGVHRRGAFRPEVRLPALAGGGRPPHRPLIRGSVASDRQCPSSPACRRA